ncbi:hypothetical protein HYT02_01200 [Candidatus Gottesmanbacteria bacterium]|nr:hypothetical protein [Candidatus Gottesmanbacteria bacterium]
MQGLLVSVKRHIIFLFLLILLTILLWLRFFVVPKSNNQAESIPVPATTISPQIQPPAAVVDVGKIPITPAVNVVSTQSISYKFTGENINLPVNLPVFNYQEPVILTENNASKLASLFGFSDDPLLTGENEAGHPYFTWNNNGETFIVGSSFPFINYIRNNPENIPHTLLPATFDIPVLSQNAAGELKNIGINNVDTTDPTITYYKVTPYAASIDEYILEETVNPAEAAYVKFAFTLTVGDYPIVSQSYKQENSYVTLDSTGQLYELFSFIIPPTSTTTLKTMSFEKIVSDISSIAIVLSVSSDLDINSEGEETYDIVNIDLTTAQIVYFLPENFSYNLKPYILFKGRSLDSKLNKEVDVLVLTPLN